MKLGVIKNKNGRIKKNKVRMKGDIEKKIKNDDKINLSIKAQGAPRRKVALEPEAQGAPKAWALVK